MNEWIDAATAAELLGLSRQRIHQLGQAKTIRRKRKPGAMAWLYLRLDVELYEVNEQNQEAGRLKTK